MRKIVFLLPLFIFFFVSNSLYAQTITIPATESAQVASMSANVQYDLPYPGILPDHPLYFLKVARDRIVGFLINDTIKKSEFNLLQTDKKIFAATMLFEKDKNELALDTLSKSNNYMHTAVAEMKKAKQAGKEISELNSRITTSITKHKEIMDNLIQNKTEPLSSLQGERARLDEIEEFHFQKVEKK